MKIVRRISAFVAVALLATGCASGMKHSEVAGKMPGLKESDGRVYFYRNASMFGAAIQPDIKLDGEKVGASQPGGFFFVDRAAGSHSAFTATEVERTLDFTLAAKETKYVRTAPSFGVLVGRIQFELVDAATAEKELSTLSYTGDAVK